MTERHEPSELPTELLTDLDAGLLDPARAAEVRAAAARDPRAAAVLAGLAATRAELGELADPQVPAQYAARWEAALAAEAGWPDRSTGGGSSPADGASVDPVTPKNTDRDLGRSSPPEDPLPKAFRPRAGRRRVPVLRRRVRPALVAGAVLAAAAVAGPLLAPREPTPMSLDGVDLASAGLAVRGDFDVGDLTDAARRAGCLRAVAPPGVAPDSLLLGGRDVVVDGRDGVLLLLAAGRPGRLHVVVVEPGCGPQGGVMLGARTIEG